MRGKIYRVPHNYLNSGFEFQPTNALESLIPYEKSGSPWTMLEACRAVNSSGFFEAFFRRRVSSWTNE
jgi:hypothetical protein